jgi:hypothetical protein
MNDHEVDARLKVLFAQQTPAADPAFSDRVILLAAWEQAERRARRRAVRRLTSEALGLIAVLAAFALLARAGPAAADAGDTIPLASPAMLGLAMLVLWLLVGFRPAGDDEVTARS